ETRHREIPRRARVVRQDAEIHRVARPAAARCRRQAAETATARAIPRRHRRVRAARSRRGLKAMAHQIETRRDLRLLACDRVTAIDHRAIAGLSERSGQHDYPGAVRVRYDEPFLKWLIQEQDWFGLLVLDEASRPVACTFALFRSLRVDGDALPAA